MLDYSIVHEIPNYQTFGEGQVVGSFDRRCVGVDLILEEVGDGHVPYFPLLLLSLSPLPASHAPFSLPLLFLSSFSILFAHVDVVSVPPTHPIGWPMSLGPFRDRSFLGRWHGCQQSR
jgi:hypothetical protein